MTLDQYTSTAIKFAKDTANWYHLDDYKWYTTNGRNWEESDDNANGGLPIDWAFHLTEDEIKQCAAENFIETAREEIQAAIDNECGLKQLQSLVDFIFG